MSGLRVVFAGTPEFGVGCLQAIHASPHTLVGVFTQPDRPAGRGRRLEPSAIKVAALAHGIEVFQPTTLRDAHARETLAALHADVMVVVAYGLLLPEVILALPRLGCVNVHASLLPRWRGASPIQQAILHGDTESGVCIMQMDKGLDTGPVFTQRTCKVLPTDTAASLHDRLAALSPELLIETLDAMAEGRASAVPQATEGVTLARRIDKDDARMDWRQDAQSIERLVRAYHPWPCAFTDIGGERIRVHAARVVPLEQPASPGTVVALETSGLVIAAGRDAVAIERLQFPGGRVLGVSEWLRGNKGDIRPGMHAE
ncbi:methionyl tRNA formyltransferase [Legionella geestiana]|uniref:Methionyl-tRNA formyltransferase n=1 Tax=Legionella geestiana TaxID=45065 RepID=A0A0W0U7A7_9GAMM|nr:methionyl-tRNA formyltransferase [Legionella geestiana]KTD03792.1 methionyl tRNA formyltransferase [Legionella geestiana]QBS11922.1 methionyl-tRNA formyltransferase [Legionella geestiana]STX53365.1 methionyl-tRNA formyltransferase [Legionella geestiana]